MKPNKEVKEKIIYTQSFKAKKSEELLSFLLEKMNTSRNNVKNILSNHQVLVNGNVVTQFNFMLGREDEVKIAKNPVRDNNKKNGAPKKRPPKIESDNDTESAYLYVSKYLEMTDKKIRPYIVHRIDKETSGVLIFTKNPYIHSILRLNWNDYVIKREYYAVVEGKMPKKEDTIKTYLKENKNNLVYVSPDKSGQLAITNYKVLNENNEYSLLRVLIDTGRKNQIRVHMNHLGHPIVFDEKYGYTKNPLKRLGLHASILEIKNPKNGEILKFEANMPSAFKALFKKEK